MSTSTWGIGTVNPGNKFLIKYDTYFPSSTKSGWYISYASAVGVDTQGAVWKTPDTIASSSVYVVNPADYAPPPPPVIVYVPPPPLPASAPMESNVGNNHENVEVNQLESLYNASPAPEPPAVPTAPAAPLTASIGSIFGNWNLANLQNAFLSSTSWVSASLFRLW